MCKDCDQHPSEQRAIVAWTIGRAVLLALFVSAPVFGASVRLWSTAVVIEDQIRLGELCDLRDFDGDTASRLRDWVLADAPPAGGSKVVSLGAVREALSAAGANMALVTVGGARECAVSRPVASIQQPQSPSDAVRGAGDSNRVQEHATAPKRDSHDASASAPGTLRQAIIEQFNGELARYNGAADVTFDRTSEQVLDLGGPSYEFRIRRRGGPQLGLIPLEIDVLADGRTLQTVPLVVQAALRRSVVVARRTINQEAAIAATDVELIPLTFTRLDDLGIDDPALAIGQRAKRVIPEGAAIGADMLEQVPLVLRGQLVTVTSVSGSIRVVTAAKATQEGRLGDLIKVRCVDDSHQEMEAIVTGPGEVRVGPRVRRMGEARLAVGEKS